MFVRDLDLAKKTSPEIYGRTCAGCKCDLDWVHFRRDSSQRDGRATLCYECESVPRLSTEEHTARLREQNLSSEVYKRQRWEGQDELKDDASRIGRPMRHADFLSVLQKLVPNLYVTEGRIQGHLAVFRTYPGPQSHLEGRDFSYLFYMDEGILPEFSQYIFDPVTDVPIKESKRGWRTVLLRLVKAGLLTEDVCNKVFGRPEGMPANRWHRELQKSRNAALGLARV
jgi:hypothetical protein